MSKPETRTVHVCGHCYEEHGLAAEVIHRPFDAARIADQGYAGVDAVCPICGNVSFTQWDMGELDLGIAIPEGADEQEMRVFRESFADVAVPPGMANPTIGFHIEVEQERSDG